MMTFKKSRSTVDRRIGLIDRLTAAITDTRDTRYITHPLRAQPASAAISLFGFESGAALATVVGVLIEVPVMLSVVYLVKRSHGWYKTGAADKL